MHYVKILQLIQITVVQQTQIEYTFKDTLHIRSVYKNYADLSLAISALNRLDRRSIPRIIVSQKELFSALSLSLSLSPEDLCI